MLKAIYEHLKKGLQKTKEQVKIGLSELNITRKIDESLFEDLEIALLKADVGVSATEEIIEFLKKTVGKLAYRFKKEGKSVVLAAADTFRAAAIEQLEVWAERTGARIVKHKPGADPAAVVFDAVNKSRGDDLVLVDTAGRLHTKEHLMKELQKIKRTIKKFSENQPCETLLILDGTIGQNSINQAKVFKESTDVSGIVITKLDGTAKGGALIPVCRELKIPIKFVGVGEGIEDLQPFDPEAFVSALLD